MLFTMISVTAKAESPVNEYRLANGLKVLIKEDHRIPIVVTEVWYRVGSSYESIGITGISHMLEHMMFKGTDKYGPGVFSKTISENGGEENAFTGSDYTAYYQLMSANKLPISLQLESDRMRNLQLKESEFTKELQVVKEERRLRTDDNPQNFTYERFSAVANVASPYHHPVIGWKSDLDQLTIADVRTWYKNWYSPNNAILVIVGDIKANETLSLVKQYFDPIPARPLPISKQSYEIENIGGRRIVVKTPAKLPLVIMGYNVPSLKTAALKPESYALDVLQSLLSGGDSARLPQTIIRGKQLAVDIEASYDIFSRLSTIFTFMAIPTQGHTVFELENAILTQIKQLQDNPIAVKELEKVKAQIIASKIFDKDSIMNQANEIGALEAVNLSWREKDSYLTNINKVTAANVQAVAKKYLISERLTIGNLKPLPIKANQVDQGIVTKGGQHVR